MEDLIKHIALFVLCLITMSTEIRLKGPHGQGATKQKDLRISPRHTPSVNGILNPALRGRGPFHFLPGTGQIEFHLQCLLVFAINNSPPFTSRCQGEIAVTGVS